MKHAFSAADTKTRRSRKHLAELEAEVAAFLATHASTISAQTIDIVGARTFAFSFEICAPPDEIGAIVGDVIHNLRAALDLTACEMVRAAGKSDTGVHFPFCRSRNDLDRMIECRNFHRAGPDTVALLKSFKPYQGGNLALRAIHDLDIQDKHKALIPNTVCAGTPIVQMWEDDGTMNPRIIGDPTAFTEFKVVFPSDAGPEGRELVPTLHEFVQIVEGIVEEFRTLANRDSPSA